MKYVFSEQAWDDYLFWQKTDKKILKRINRLIKDISRDPFRGAGKPEPLKHALLLGHHLLLEADQALVLAWDQRLSMFLAETCS